MGYEPCTNFIIRRKERLQYGSESPSRFVPAEKGRRNIYVISEGALEKEEIDDIVGEAQEKEDTRIKQKYKSVTKERLEQVVEATRKAKRGERAKTAQLIIRGAETRWI